MIFFLLLFLILFPPPATWTRIARGVVEPPTTTSLNDKCASDEQQNRHTYFWTVVHPDQPNVTHHLFGYPPTNDAELWDTLAPAVRARFDAANVTVFAGHDGGMPQLQACVRERAAAGARVQLPAALAQRLDAYLARHPHALLVPFLDREWRALPADWLLVSLLRVHFDQMQLILLQNSSAERSSILQRMVDHAGQRAAYVDFTQEQCRILPSLKEQNREMVSLGVAHLLNELEEAERAAPARVRAGPIGRVLTLYRCGRFEARDDMLGEAEHWMSGSGDSERRVQLEKLNRLLLHDLIEIWTAPFVDRIGPMLLRNGTQVHFIALVATSLLKLPGDAGASVVDALRRHGFRVDEVPWQAVNALPMDAGADVQLDKTAAKILQDDTQPAAID